jgi:predicted MFS family arabinose efflux permease
MTMEAFTKDFTLRIKHYQDIYQTLGEKQAHYPISKYFFKTPSTVFLTSCYFLFIVFVNRFFPTYISDKDRDKIPFIKLLDGGRQIVMNQINDYLTSRIAHVRIVFFFVCLFVCLLLKLKSSPASFACVYIFVIFFLFGFEEVNISCL